MGWSLTSTAFAQDERIPVKYTQDGENVSPPLTWTTPPEGTEQLALICDDPDAPSGTFTHWVAYDIAPELTALPEGVPTTPEVQEPALKQGVNSAKKMGYAGPAPPPGKVHHYHFMLYALKEPVSLPPGATKSALQTAMEGKVLAEAHLVGTYSR